MEQTRICKKCGVEKPIEKYDYVKSNSGKIYRMYTCRSCRQQHYTDEKNKISSNVDIISKRKFKEISKKQILNIDDTNILPIGTDEIFVKMVDYRNVWISNYGRAVRKKDNDYALLKAKIGTGGKLFYTVKKDAFIDGKWQYKSTYLYADKAVVQEFIVNPDVKNNVFIWHSGYNKEDNYFRNLYPLTKEQYWVVKAHFDKYGDISEDDIIKIMNDIKFKDDDFSYKSMNPVVRGIGYHGMRNVDVQSEAYQRWKDMFYRCYNEKSHEWHPTYTECTVCDEWHSFNNFQKWYDDNKYVGDFLDLDKDILIKGNTVYSPDTCCLVPHSINTLVTNCKSARGEYPIGVSRDKNKYRAELVYLNVREKLGTYNTPEEAFAAYKKRKEELIKATAEQYKGKIPNKVYYALMDWEIEITD